MTQPRFGSVTSRSALGEHRIAYTEWGDPDNDQVLVCVHGVTRQGRDFDVLARAMSDAYRVVCPDMVGRGRSDWLPDVPGAHSLYSVPQYVTDCTALLAHLGARTVDWVGTSMGGLIAMGMWAVSSPSRGNPMRRLVLNDIGPIVLGGALDRIGAYIGRMPRWESVDEGIAYLAEVNASFGPHSDEEWAAFSLPMIVQKTDTRGSYFTLHYDPRIGDAFRDQAKDLAGSDMLLWQLYDAMTCETLALRGALSDLLPGAVHAEMAERGPRAKIVEIPGVGHAPTLVPLEQVAVVRRFLLHGATP
jgi:pimeloyl-ACP methyl ester carboxylesterase